MAHETDYQRRRRQSNEVKKYGVTGSTIEEAKKRIKEHSNAKHKALLNQKELSKIPKYPEGYDRNSVPNAIKRGELRRKMLKE